MSNDVARTTNDLPATPQRAPLFGQQDYAELGAYIQAIGLSPATARAVVAEMQQNATQVAMASAANMLQLLRVHSAGRVADLIGRIQAMGSLGGYIRRDLVLMAIQQTFTGDPSLR